MAKVSSATNAKLPFGMGTVDLTSGSAIFYVIALTLGMMIYSIANAVGQNLANQVLGTAGGYIPGGNPAEDGAEAPDGV